MTCDLHSGAFVHMLRGLVLVDTCGYEERNCLDSRLLYP